MDPRSKQNENKHHSSDKMGHLQTQLREFKFNKELCNINSTIVNENKRLRLRENKHNRL